MSEHPVALLRAGRERPRGSRAAEQRDELAVARSEARGCDFNFHGPRGGR
jgi:hypothetical protein